MPLTNKLEYLSLFGRERLAFRVEHLKDLVEMARANTSLFAWSISKEEKCFLSVNG
jgi:hypothetical protein